MINLKFKLAAPRPAVASAVVAIMTDILSPGRVPRPRGFRVPLTDPTVLHIVYIPHASLYPLLSLGPVTQSHRPGHGSSVTAAAARPGRVRPDEYQ